MTIEVEKLLNPVARSPYKFLVEPGQGCYIPAYQRPYSWDKDNISRLLDDVATGLRGLLTRKETINFIGTVIAIHDTENKTVQPQVQDDVANRVMSIIDGQQRLSTILLLTIEIHHQLSLLGKKVGKVPNEAVVNWLNKRTKETLPSLKLMFELNMQHGEGVYQYYPRIIRAYDDQWSRTPAHAKYDSPLAQLNWQYIQHLRDENATEFEYQPNVPSGKRDNQYSLLKTTNDHIRKTIKDFMKGEKFEDLPGIEDMANSNCFAKSVFNYDFVDNVKNYFNEATNEKGFDTICKLVRLLALANYLIHRMAFTVVTTGNEDDAFDMFEALNTTGEPLTAYETFKPLVINAEEIGKYEHSESKRYIEQIEPYLDKFPDASKKQKATTNLFVPFALSETAYQLGKRLIFQRKYLRQQFQAKENLEDKRAFVKRISQITNFVNFGWDVEKGTQPFADFDSDDGYFIVSFELLRSMKHHITIAPLSRFFSDFQNAVTKDAKVNKWKAFEEAVKATAAFTVIWRARFGGTSNIDNKYRAIMKGAEVDGIQHAPLAFRNKEGDIGAVNLNNYKKTLLSFLKEENITDKEQWSKLASTVPIYTKSRQVARFVLLAASHDAKPDPKTPGLVIKGTKGVQPLLTYEHWKDKDYLTVEHIAPQHRQSEWDDKIYEDKDQIHRIGNLILLPPEQNTLASNNSWETKKILYELCGAEHKENRAKLLETLQAQPNITLKKSVQEMLQGSKYLPMCKSIAEYQGVWSVNAINERSERILSLAWDTVIAWLK